MMTTLWEDMRSGWEMADRTERDETDGGEMDAE